MGFVLRQTEGDALWKGASWRMGVAWCQVCVDCNPSLPLLSNNLSQPHVLFSLCFVSLHLTVVPRESRELDGVCLVMSSVHSVMAAQRRNQTVSYCLRRVVFLPLKKLKCIFILFLPLGFLG